MRVLCFCIYIFTNIDWVQYLSTGHFCQLSSSWRCHGGKEILARNRSSAWRQEILGRAWLRTIWATSPNDRFLRIMRRRASWHCAPSHPSQRDQRDQPPECPCTRRWLQPHVNISQCSVLVVAMMAYAKMALGKRLKGPWWYHRIPLGPTAHKHDQSPYHAHQSFGLMLQPGSSSISFASCHARLLLLCTSGCRNWNRSCVPDEAVCLWAFWLVNPALE